MRPRLIGTVLFLLLLAAFSWFLLKGCSHPPVSPPVEVPLNPVQPAKMPEVSPTTIPIPVEPVKPAKVAPVVASKPVKKAPPATPVLAPPPVELHKELIPKDIEIVRVYYANTIGSPGSTIEFDINGSGFNEEFQKMITAESGNPSVSIRGLALKTPNQIHGTLVADAKTATAISFPRVLINGKVVFQAPDPFAIIRPGEVLNVVFTEMGESGRTGRFRVFTNLTPEMLNDFKVVASTSLIQITDLAPLLPYVIDGNIIIGPAAGGEYGLKVLLKDKVLWNRDGIIRVVRPNVGQSGLVQRVLPTEEFFRPGDKALFGIQGSGFRPEDGGLLSIKVKNLDVKGSTFTYLAPGRMELRFDMPANAAPGRYGLTIVQGSDTLLDLESVFSVVDKNWMRELRLQPALKPGGKGSVMILGRDLSPDYISQIKTQMDEPELEVGNFTWVGADLAEAPIAAGVHVKPGDYLLHMTIGGKPVTPQFGSIIRIEPSN